MRECVGPKECGRQSALLSEPVHERSTFLQCFFSLFWKAATYEEPLHVRLMVKRERERAIKYIRQTASILIRGLHSQNHSRTFHSIPDAEGGRMIPDSTCKVFRKASTVKKPVGIGTGHLPGWQTDRHSHIDRQTGRQPDKPPPTKLYVSNRRPHTVSQALVSVIFHAPNVCS